ncbi:O-antigen ligase family protein [Cryobacterium sp. TMT2-10]|uniref:O-antigen ligase family protein n=1 Tax=unclassified Cryobacterium TaxID=2649013 RepID=UPI0010692A50|nr:MULTISPECIES: O-antigen ligase family protein [unclassified Cryobacterium]TFC82064.1 O-antigen ligase family protein [Cryobacterium sp. TmT2-59]TFD17292.1 O-antigen ligase family protein [Cryobacterium sp. TMT2-23]TFD21942.1 O-antigen ligase family protein [Cryobacterium sp. TMT4-10]TFD36855.1 O-antigen ligase family protein [Cryobacterium sp. TMT2-10]
MTYRANRPAAPAPFTRLFASPKFAAALTVLILGFAFGTHAVRSLIGWPGLLGVLVGLVALAAFSLSARWASIDWHGLLPISIMVFVGWCALSLLWTGYPFETLSAVLYQLAFTFLAVYIALARDTIQIVRATGDVLRFLLVASLALEVLSGLLLDLPIAFLGIQGNIATLGPVQGLFGSRNLFGLVSLIAGVTFVVELRSRSVPRSIGVGSIALAGFALLLTRSPVMLVVALFVGVAALALYWLRHTPAEGRWILQIGLLITSAVAGIAGFIARARITELLNAGSEFEVRSTLWSEMWRLGRLHPLEGWGWAGLWPAQVTPYGWLDFVTGREHTSGLNAFLDVYFQVGLVGLLAFLALVGLAFWRSWLLASDKRPVVYVWSPLILVLLLVTSAAESTVLVEFGWLLLLICAVKAAQGKSWRSLLQPSPHRYHE